LKCIFGEVYDSLDDKSLKCDDAGEVLWGRRLPVLVLAFGLVPAGFIRVYGSFDDKCSNECDDVGDILRCQRVLPGRHERALAGGGASFGDDVG
jgi:hypothetical protein